MLSYAYPFTRSQCKTPCRAPNYEPQSPSKSPSPRSRRAQTSRTVDDVSRDEDDNILSRYTQLKQRNDELASRPGGPGIITTPPQPSLASAKGTSVNIASAFFQAASSYTTTAATTAMSTSSKWTNKQHVPRSTSVEYEQQAQSTSHRRLAPPPSRTGSRLGASKPNSRASARGSDIENERSGESFGLNGRAKSPFDIMADVASGVMKPVATILMRQRSQEPEGVQSRQGTDATLVAQNNNSGSYDYADEEEEVERMERASKRNTAASQAPRRGRISTDNMAYRPTTSDVEDESEEDEDGRKGRRRRKKKADSSAGLLQNLPKVNYDKRKRRRGRTGRPGEEGEEASGEEQDQISEEVSSSLSPTCLRPLNVFSSNLCVLDPYLVDLFLRQDGILFPLNPTATAMVAQRMTRISNKALNRYQRLMNSMLMALKRKNIVMGRDLNPVRVLAHDLVLERRRASR